MRETRSPCEARLDRTAKHLPVSFVNKSIANMNTGEALMVIAVVLDTREAGREALMVTAVVLNTCGAGRETLMVIAVVLNTGPAFQQPAA